MRRVSDVHIKVFLFQSLLGFDGILCGSGSGLDQLMTPEEKEKLYTAIGYSGSSHNLSLPRQVPTSAHDTLDTHDTLCCSCCVTLH